MDANNIDWGAFLRARGHRLTPQRLLILESLQSMNGHATAEEVFAQAQHRSQAINRATVYRALHFLSGLGIVTSTSGAGGHLLYEMAHSVPHHHLNCTRCGASLTLPHALVAPLVKEIETTLDFQVFETLHLSLFGICGSCR
jgi:Fe2+ or Zn2+ uptake regulation protein